jgi:hypothetical protein
VSFLIMTHLSLCPYNLIVLYSEERSEGEYKLNYIYRVRSFGFGNVHFIVRLCHVTIALVFKLVTWILRHRGLAIAVCKAGLHSLNCNRVKDIDLYLYCMLYRIFLVYHCIVLLKVIASAIPNYDSLVFVPI